MHKNGNGNGWGTIHDQPLSELQKSALLSALEQGDCATLQQVMDGYYGAGLSPVEWRRAQAAISRARRGLVTRGLIGDIRGNFVLTLDGARIAQKLAQLPSVPVIRKVADLVEYRRAEAAHREYDALLISLGKRRITISEALDGCSPRYVRPHHRIPAASHQRRA